MRKRKRIPRHEIYAKRRVNICSLDQYGLGLKRIFKFLAMLSQSCQHGDFSGPWRFWRRGRVCFQLARRCIRITL